MARDTERTGDGLVALHHRRPPGDNITALVLLRSPYNYTASLVFQLQSSRPRDTLTLDLACPWFTVQNICMLGLETT